MYSQPVFSKATMLKVTKELLKLTKFHIKIEPSRRRSSLKPFDDHFMITFSNGNDTSENNSQRLYYIWLRDHCRCEECINRTTFQKSYHLLDISLNVKPTEYQLEQNKLSIKWDDGHDSEFCLKWLKSVLQPVIPKREFLFWNKYTGNNNIMDTSISFDELKNNKTKCEIKLLKFLLKYGFAFINGIEPSLGATENAITTFFPVCKTHFGEMWQVTDNYLHKDTAYTNALLAPHTDNTYWSEAAGLMVFHMLSHNGTGGNTLLVDGFNVANNLKSSNSQFYDILTKKLIECEYIDEGVHYNNSDYVIKEHPLTNELWQIRFNVYDRAVLKTVRSEEIMTFYKAYRAFGEEVANKNNQVSVKLTPGTILIIDNWRVMHGREAFTGSRILGGCYISRAEWLCKARSHGLLIH